MLHDLVKSFNQKIWGNIWGVPKYWGKWRNYKFDIIKLDRSFFYGKNGFTDRSKETVKSIIDLAYKLQKAVVAEEKRKLWLISWRLPNVILFRDIIMLSL